MGAANRREIVSRPRAFTALSKVVSNMPTLSEGVKNYVHHVRFLIRPLFHLPADAERDAFLCRFPHRNEHARTGGGIPSPNQTRRRTRPPTRPPPRPGPRPSVVASDGSVRHAFFGRAAKTKTAAPVLKRQKRLTVEESFAHLTNLHTSPPPHPYQAVILFFSVMIVASLTMAFTYVPAKIKREPFTVRRSDKCFVSNETVCDTYARSQFFFWNLTNAQEVVDGLAPPVLVEVGPYVLHGGKEKKSDIEFHAPRNASEDGTCWPFTK